MTESRIRRALASVMERKATDIRRRDLRQIFDTVADKGHKAAAEQQRSLVQAMFRWALRQDIIEIDPSAGLGVYDQPVARERVLDPDEIRALWEWLGTGDMPSRIADILKLQLCLGARVGEVCGLMAEELEHDGSGRLLWRLPAERSKNGSDRVTPIVGLALEIIEPRLKTARAMADCLCPGAEQPRRQPRGKGDHPAPRRAPIEEFSHDLRRTAATQMAKLGLPLDLVATVLGHETGGGETRILRKHYIHDQFVDRKAHALAVGPAASGDPCRRGRRRSGGRFSGQIAGSTNLGKDAQPQPNAAMLPLLFFVLRPLAVDCKILVFCAPNGGRCGRKGQRFSPPRGWQRAFF